MVQFNKWNTFAGWGVFAVAFTTYVTTMERTASFWDCGEFIACAFKLQVPHPPGAPFFLLIGRLFSLLALGDVTKVAYWVNMLSVLSSAFTVLFLFWTITMLAGKLVDKPQNSWSKAQSMLVIGCGAAGALAYAWSDSFWFSAGEAEVYAMSSFFTAIVIWAVFRWERINDPAQANRWLILIAYLVGLSIGVHLLNLVTIPALSLVYYFRKFPKPTVFGGFAAFVTGLLILAMINAGIIPGLPGLAGSFEVFFVNSLGLPYNSGVIFFSVLFFAALTSAIIYSHKKQKVILNTALLSLAFVLTGYGSYLMVLVRSGYNPPINENNPSDVLRFVSYLKREQYESRPLLYGPQFTSRLTASRQGTPVYTRRDGRYVVTDRRPEYEYEPGSHMLLPRLYSSQPGHPELYRQITGLREGQTPTMRHNLTYLFSHQLGHMYWRYFLWNFVGRESDREGAGVLLPWDAFRTFPSSIQSNRAHDNLFMLPLLLGIAGAVFMYTKRKKDLLVLVLLFVLTGIALAFYLNSPPVEPRERDYIYVGSFYIFCIWIGLGIMAMSHAAQRIVRDQNIRTGIVAALGLAVPAWMGIRGWDNHDRSNRYHSVDFARNLLNSCAPHAILFTGGDNDTFPLWYVQEVEGFRKDVRVCVQTFIGIDWYIEQLRRKINDSDALPLSLDTGNYINGQNDYIPFYEVASVRKGVNLNEYLDLVRQNNKAIRVPLSNGETTSILPSSTMFLPVDTAAVRRMHIVKKDFEPFLTDSMSWNIGNKDLFKSDLVMLDIIASNNWKRPIYFSSTMGSSHHLGLKEYMQLEGYAYRLLPVKVEGAEDGYVNSDIMYDNMMHKTFWRDMNNAKTYYDDTYLGSPVATARISFLRLAGQLIAEKQMDKARNVLDKAMRVMPDDTIPYDQFSAGFVGMFFDVGENKKALDSARTMALRADENLSWVHENGGNRNVSKDLYILQTLARECYGAGQKAAGKQYEDMFRKHLLAFNLYTKEVP
ncbi:glycosyltransferase family 117 protein [Dyadobacter sandarakinus]|uniref:DUF2723 domain-containing protein n=1 Tax=Dyadobacter sandarakinus TaxID=2747268 RepID=A0ABX7I4J0_9BACT|nr:DUF2723 domain-containing protein [Dyadobacter sandarakinus]QRR00992.1 DUF2723 domain-containing protein [Dyadobacter sandarakinus]